MHIAVSITMSRHFRTIPAAWVSALVAHYHILQFRNFRTIPAAQVSPLITHHHIQLLMTQVIIKRAAPIADLTDPNDRLKTVGVGQHLTEQVRNLKELFRMINFGVFILEYSCIQNPGLNEVLEDMAAV